MHNTQRNQAVTSTEPVTIYREQTLLERIAEEGRIGQMPDADDEPAKLPSLLDLIAEEGRVSQVPMGRRIVNLQGRMEVVRQDNDLQCQGGLFGAVDASENAYAVGLHGSQIPFGMTEVAPGTDGSCCICGDGRCKIGPFIAGGAR